MLQPLFDDVGIRIGGGRYDVQLEIPQGSTLTSYEIDRILALSSWDVDPNKEVDGYEGSRSVLLRRQSSVRRGGVELHGLQVSGIGYRETMNTGAIYIIDDDSPFYPPTADNFMNFATDVQMSTPHLEGRKIVARRPEYRARGTYLQPELKEKVRNTMEVSHLTLEKISVPNIEAYGRYLSPGLQNEDGPFGFIVFPVPDPETGRAMHNMSKQLFRKNRHIRPEAAFAEIFSLVTPPTGALVQGLREVHDNGLVHLQTHFNNYYATQPVPYLVDWGTTVRLGEDREENVLYRAIELNQVVGFYKDAFGIFLRKMGLPTSKLNVMAPKLQEVTLRYYSGVPEKQIDMKSVISRAKRVLGPNVNSVDVISQWMKDTGHEGFHRI